MVDSDVLEDLRSCDFFRDIADEHLQKLAEICREVAFPAQATIFEEYGRAKTVYVVLSGEISVAICEPDDFCRQIAVVHPGELLGWSPLVGRSRLYDTARTASPVKALAFDGDQLMDFCAANPSFGFEFMRQTARVLSERLSGTRLQLLEMCGIHLPEFQLESD